MKLAVIVIVVIAFTLSVYANEPSQRLIQAQIKVESNGDDLAIGDRNLKNKAYGCLQIRQPVCDDVNRKYGTSYKAEQCLGNRQLSIEIYRKYLSIYGKGKNEEQIARIWNGGPRGATKESTVRYWMKVQRMM